MTEQQPNLDIASRLRARREYLNIPQRELADKLGITRVGYGKYESGDVDVTASTLQRLAGVLRVPVGYFFGEDEEVYAGERDIVSYYRALPAEHRAAAVAVLKALLDNVPGAAEGSGT
jgi:transcriptional regulator with XRE-family HTH domain